MTDRAMNTKSTMNITDICDVKKVSTTMGADQQSVVVGFIHGFCNDTQTRKSLDGLSMNEGMLGQFEMIPADAAQPILRSPICYLPRQYQSTITNVLKLQAGEKGKGVVTGATFATEVSIERDGNGGFRWALVFIGEVQSLDPFIKTRVLIAAHLAPKNEPGEAKPASHGAEVSGDHKPAQKVAGKR